MNIIFDLDGTIYQTHLSYVRAFQDVMKSYSLPVPDREIIMEKIGLSSQGSTIQFATESQSIPWDDLHQEIRNKEKEYLNHYGQLYPGILEILKNLSLRHQLFLVSNGSREYLSAIFEAFPIERYFRNVYSARSYDRKSDCVRELLSSLEPNDTVIVGDTTSDFDAGNEDNLPSIGVSYGYGGEDIVQASFIADTPDEIISKIDRLECYFTIYRNLNIRSSHRPLIIGINGVDASGKTFFSQNFSKFLNAIGHHSIIIHLDDFHNPSVIRKQGENEIGAYINNAFNLKRLKEQVLEPIRNMNAKDEINISLDTLDLETDKNTAHVDYTIRKETIILLEGVLLFREPIDGFLDRRLFLDIGFEEVIRRVRDRDVHLFGEGLEERYRNKYIPIQQWYIDTYKPQERADIVIDNTDFRSPRIIEDMEG